MHMKIIDSYDNLQTYYFGIIDYLTPYENLKKLEYLYDNYNMGMNVFRTAKGGRDKISE